MPRYKPDKTGWERNRHRIEKYYKAHTLKQTIRLMETKHNFIADKRQYVYRLEQWDIKKYKTTPSQGAGKPGQQRQGRRVTTSPDGSVPPSPSNEVQQPLEAPRTPLPGSPDDTKLHGAHQSTDVTVSILQSGDPSSWIRGQKLRSDLMHAIPNNCHGFAASNKLLHSLRPDFRMGSPQQTILSACILRVNASHDPELRKGLLDSLRGMKQLFQRSGDELRYRALRFLLDPWGSEPGEVLSSEITLHLSQSDVVDLDLFVMLYVMGSQTNQPETGTLAIAGLLTTATFAAKLGPQHRPTALLRTIIKWCGDTCTSDAGLQQITMPAATWSMWQMQQRDIISVTCALASRLYDGPLESTPGWVQETEPQLGISPITCIAAAIRMLYHVGAQQQSVMLIPFGEANAYDFVGFGASNMLDSFDADLWSPFLNVLLEIEGSPGRPCSHTLPTEFTGAVGYDDPTNDDEAFIHALSDAVERFIRDEDASELDVPLTCPGLSYTSSCGARTPQPPPEQSSYPAVDSPDLPNDLVFVGGSAATLESLFADDTFDMDFTDMMPDSLHVPVMSHHHHISYDHHTLSADPAETTAKSAPFPHLFG